MEVKVKDRGIVIEENGVTVSLGSNKQWSKYNNGDRFSVATSEDNNSVIIIDTIMKVGQTFKSPATADALAIGETVIVNNALGVFYYDPYRKKMFLLNADNIEAPIVQAEFSEDYSLKFIHITESHVMYPMTVETTPTENEIKNFGVRLILFGGRPWVLRQLHSNWQKL